MAIFVPTFTASGSVDGSFWQISLQKSARVNLDRCPHARARGARRFQRALTQSDLLEPPGRRCGCWSTSPMSAGAGATYGVIDNRSENLQH
jgi:hypothetical protein